MRTTSTVLILCFTLELIACRKAQPPQIPRGDPAAAEQVYADHALSFDGGFWGNRWRRADGAYTLDNVAPATDVYPVSRGVRKRARRRTMLVTVMAAIAGATLGYTAGRQLLGPEEDQLTAEQAMPLYITGGALAFGALLIDYLWVKPVYRDLATTYNDALRLDVSGQ